MNHPDLTSRSLARLGPLAAQPRRAGGRVGRARSAAGTSASTASGTTKEFSRPAAPTATAGLAGAGARGYNDGAEDPAMPLRDHFRPPLERRRHWQGFHAQWPAMIVLTLAPKLPRRYVAEPRVQLGVSAEIDVGTFEEDDASSSGLSRGTGNGEEGGTATAVWAPPRPTLTLATDFPAETAYEVRVFDLERGSRLVAAVEIVSPANKDRPENRRAFVAKCACPASGAGVGDDRRCGDDAALQPVRRAVGADRWDGPGPGAESPAVYAAACRGTKKDNTWLLETWMCPVALGQPLPTLPLWLADNFAVPLELEASYEETCRILRLV